MKISSQIGGGRRRQGAGRLSRVAAGAAATALLLAGCSTPDAGSDSGKTDIVVAIVSNPQMQDAISLQDEFSARHPDINVKFVSLPENEARAKITASVATGGGEFDVVMISNYETPMWAENGWITNLQPYAERTPGLRPGRLRPHHQGRTQPRRRPVFGPVLRGVLLPGLPQGPLREGRADHAAESDLGGHQGFRRRAARPGKKDFAGICLRGLAGWGEVMAPLGTVINTYGGRWFDEDWNATLDSPEVEAAVTDYVDLVRTSGQPGAATSGYGDCLTRYSQGNAAMWYDATAMVSSIEDPKSSTVVGKTAYAPAPVKDTESAGWLYSWSLAIPETSKHKDAAWDFVSWMTNKDYIKLVGNEVGWERVPPGSRKSTYENPRVRQGGAGLCRAHAGRDERRFAEVQHDRGRAVPGPAVRRHPRVPGPGHPGWAADLRRHRRPEDRGRGPRTVAAVRRTVAESYKADAGRPEENK